MRLFLFLVLLAVSVSTVFSDTTHTFSDQICTTYISMESVSFGTESVPFKYACMNHDLCYCRHYYQVPEDQQIHECDTNLRTDLQTLCQKSLTNDILREMCKNTFPHVFRAATRALGGDFQPRGPDNYCEVTFYDTNENLIGRENVNAIKPVLEGIPYVDIEEHAEEAYESNKSNGDFVNALNTALVASVGKPLLEIAVAVGVAENFTDGNDFDDLKQLTSEKLVELNTTITNTLNQANSALNNIGSSYHISVKDLEEALRNPIGVIENTSENIQKAGQNVINTIFSRNGQKQQGDMSVAIEWKQDFMDQLGEFYIRTQLIITKAHAQVAAAAKAKAAANQKLIDDSEKAVNDYIKEIQQENEAFNRDFVQQYNDYHNTEVSIGTTPVAEELDIYKSRSVYLEFLNADDQYYEISFSGTNSDNFFASHSYGGVLDCDQASVCRLIRSKDTSIEVTTPLDGNQNVTLQITPIPIEEMTTSFSIAKNYQGWSIYKVTSLKNESVLQITSTSAPFYVSTAIPTLTDYECYSSQCIFHSPSSDSFFLGVLSKEEDSSAIPIYIKDHKDTWKSCAALGKKCHILKPALAKLVSGNKTYYQLFPKGEVPCYADKFTQDHISSGKCFIHRQVLSLRELTSIAL